MLLVEFVSHRHVLLVKSVVSRLIVPDQQNRYPSRIKGIENTDRPTAALYPTARAYFGGSNFLYPMSRGTVAGGRALGATQPLR